jgi:hypothetical protein
MNESMPSAGDKRDDAMTLIEQLLDEFSGAGMGKEIIGQLLAGQQSPKKLAQRIGQSAAFERIHKEARTFHQGHSGRLCSNPGTPRIRSYTGSIVSFTPSLTADLTGFEPFSMY